MLSKIFRITFIAAAVFLFPFVRSGYADWSIGVGVGDGHEHHDHWDHDRRWDHDRDEHWEHEHYRWHDHPDWGYHIHYLPDGYYSVWVDGQRYYYYNGLYYTYIGFGDYELVQPPIGAYVTAIPPDFQPEIVNGITYYTNGGVYYRWTPHGYRVVPAPVVYAQPVQVVEPPPVAQAVPAPAPDQDAFSINVPNNSGGYTAVLIKKSGSGYVGPQGEFYATFPSVAQLKAMYGK